MEENALKKLASSKQYVLERHDYGWVVCDNIHKLQAVIVPHTYQIRVYMEFVAEPDITWQLEQIDLPSLDNFRSFLDTLVNFLRIKDWEEGEEK